MFDGVLANFIPKYQELVISVTGKDLFHPEDKKNPPCWMWPELRGYTPAEMAEVWRRITTNDLFWLNLPPIDEEVSTMRSMVKELERCHDVYYITHRPGIRAKRQTEIWLTDHLTYPMRVQGVTPTVIVSGEKGAVAKALKLDAYIDDNLDNVLGVAKASPSTHTYLKSMRYNANDDVNDELSYFRVSSLAEMFDIEIAHNRL